MNSTRRTSIATGPLFILATIAALAAAALQPALTGTDYLTGVANHPNQLAAAALLYLIAVVTAGVFFLDTESTAIAARSGYSR